MYDTIKNVVIEFGEVWGGGSGTRPGLWMARGWLWAQGLEGRELSHGSEGWEDILGTNLISTMEASFGAGTALELERASHLWHRTLFLSNSGME